ncbi:MAG TPA: type II secretion system protein [Candidatus Paceibacterota bacterium]|nr:type II secretion system protein [Candidatus Paceibacterota bacterium]
MKFATATNSRRTFAHPSSRTHCESAFTLAEVLAAMLFMAIVIPVAMEALHIASVAGEVGVRKAEAARVADRILNGNIVTTNWTQSSLSGTTVENGHEFQWTLKNQLWPADSTMQLLSAEVNFSASGRQYSVRLNTLAGTPTFGTTTMAGLQ